MLLLPHPTWDYSLRENFKTGQISTTRATGIPAAGCLSFRDGLLKVVHRETVQESLFCGYPSLASNTSDFQDFPKYSSYFVLSLRMVASKA